MATTNNEIQKRAFTELSEVDTANDTDILVLQDAVSTRRITFLNLFTKIKTKLNLEKVATSGLLADLTGDANNRVVTDKEKTKWNGYDTTIKELNADLAGKADIVVLQNANTARSGIFFGDNLQNGAAGSGMEMIVACSNGTNVIQHSTVMSGANANSVFVRRYLNNAWSPWTAK